MAETSVFKPFETVNSFVREPIPWKKKGNDKSQSQPVTRCSLFLQSIAFENRVCWSAVHSNLPIDIIIPGIGKFRC